MSEVSDERLVRVCGLPFLNFFLGILYRNICLGFLTFFLRYLQTIVNPPWSRLTIQSFVHICVRLKIWVLQLLCVTFSSLKSKINRKGSNLENTVDEAAVRSQIWPIWPWQLHLRFAQKWTNVELIVPTAFSWPKCHVYCMYSHV